MCSFGLWIISLTGFLLTKCALKLPTSMVDSVELIMGNLTHLPAKRPASSSSKRKTPATLDFVIDAIMTNGASLAQEEGRWYNRDGGDAWSKEPDGQYQLSAKLLALVSSDADMAKESSKAETTAAQDQKIMFQDQCQIAAAEAVGRIVLNGQGSRNPEMTQLANDLAARLAWTLKKVQPPSQLKPAQDMALDAIQSTKKRLEETEKQEALDKLASSFPLVTSCLALDATSTVNYAIEGKANAPSLRSSVLNEAFAQSSFRESMESEENEKSWKFDSALDLFCGTILHSSERSSDKATDNDRKRVATNLAASLQRELSILPSISSSALTIIGGMCDFDEISKKAAEAARKTSQQTIAASAAFHAAKQAAEKRATTALLALRDAAFQRSNPEARQSAVRTAVALAGGRLGASSSCEDKALKLVMNVLYARSDVLADQVVEAAVAELKLASEYAIENYGKIQTANSAAKAKENPAEHTPNGPFAPESAEDKLAMEKVKKPAVLFMALCIRRPKIIKILFELSAAPKADVLSKAVRQNMAKLSKAVGIKHGAAEMALQVADMADHAEAPLLLAFLDNLTPMGDKNMPPQDFIDACYKIQEKKEAGGRKDARYLIPVVSVMKRNELVEKLPEFVDADDNIFIAALAKMGERLGRHALLFREEPEPETPTLKGLTLCEQLVYLHKLDFAAAGLPQKRYLDAIRVCLENDELFSDRLVMSALDHMSGTFLTGTDKLPLAYMRTIILVCSKHESLHNWICHTLLPRLVEGKIYADRRQWEGWMRCAKMLENSEDGVSSAEAIESLPAEQLAMYRARYH
jgi:symplekin